MRRRRAERLALRADVAADAGCLDDARACLEEARTLAPGLPELALVEAKLSAPPRRRASSTFKWALLATACAAAMVAGVAIARTAAPPELIEVRPLSLAAPTAEIAPRVRRDAATPPARPEEPEPTRQIQVPVKATAPLPEVRQVERVIKTANNVRTELTPAAAASAVAASSLVSTPPSVPIEPAALTEIPPAPPAVIAPPAEPPQESVVRSVLSRYASAYSALDANAAQRVWPGVNREALSRAFGSLASQQISLGDCRVDVAGSSARAHCAGSATWAPKVGGGGVRTEARDWTFELARAGSGWQIVSARVQNK